MWGNLSEGIDAMATTAQVEVADEWMSEGSCQRAEYEDRECLDCPVILICIESTNPDMDQKNVVTLYQ